ncbi:leucine-rich repeat-containing protein [gut metagenome]|uniref:Leucine-rich repeat-containing protein n=1 Tax=gut metagenome TaxID=749906 RepID=J9GQM7_9ZZZZ
MDGPKWSYYGEAMPMGSNWNFDKEPDMWGFQPGVQLLDNGRVASVVISGFGARNKVPDAIGQLTELRVLNLGAHDDLVGGHLFQGVGSQMTDEQRMKIRMDYEQKYLYHDIREDMSQILIDGINANPNFQPIRKSHRIEPKDVQVGNHTNQITGISKALMRCTKLENFFIANSPISEKFFCTELVDDPDSPYRKAFEEEESQWKWADFTMLTDMEIYNCSGLTHFPDLLINAEDALPELQMLNMACNANIQGTDFLNDWNQFIDAASGKKIQVLYLGYNNLEEIPEHSQLKKMVKLGMLDATNNKIKKLHPFGKTINLAKVYLDNNQITEIPVASDGYFCGYYDMELFSVSHNKLTEIPDIFNANSKYMIGSIDLSNNEITGCQNGEAHHGINTGKLNLSYNKLEKFPATLIKKGSPLSELNLQGNGMKTIKKGDLTGPKSYMLISIDLQFNKLKEIPYADFLPENLPYLYGLEFSYNQFSEFPVAPLNCNSLTVFGIRHQRDEAGNRTLREWPKGLYTCPRLTAFFIGSNDLRKIDDTISPFIRIFEIKDNPNISIDLSAVCPYIKAGQYQLIYDKTQDIKGCDILLD